MMKKVFIFLFLPFTVSPGAFAQSQSTVVFDGEVVSDTCSIVSTDLNQTVHLPTVSAQDLNTAGKTAGSKDFSINVENCPNTLKHVTAHFEANNGTLGYDVKTHNVSNMFKDTSGAANPAAPAKDVQVRIFDQDGTTQVEVAGTDGQSIPISSGKAKIPYVAAYYSTGAATAGKVLATVAYTLVYN
ncbi:fimbrial protein [Rosenbergiella epipactidis]|uniref:fimbrial protein n=1 Tax=Rosenbergiella epipactidis TaxID=1544694 RepID=UPI001F4F6AEE|nr:fimbrial protein [Rosenbergiella epipactidis]